MAHIQMFIIPYCNQIIKQKVLINPAISISQEYDKNFFRKEIYINYFKIIFGINLYI